METTLQELLAMIGEFAVRDRAQQAQIAEWERRAAEMQARIDALEAPPARGPLG